MVLHIMNDDRFSIIDMEEERQIRIVCRKKGGMLVVSISNPVEKDAEYRKKSFSDGFAYHE